MRNALYGNLGGSFAGSGGRLFRRDILTWFLAVAALVAGLVSALAVLDWPVATDDEDLQNAVDLLNVSDNLRLGAWLVGGGAGLSLLLGGVLYWPIKQS